MNVLVQARLQMPAALMVQGVGQTDQHQYLTFMLGGEVYAMPKVYARNCP